MTFLTLLRVLADYKLEYYINPPKMAMHFVLMQNKATTLNMKYRKEVGHSCKYLDIDNNRSKFKLQSRFAEQI